jgi:acetyl-CoA carboxylase carboxyltransferase component
MSERHRRLICGFLWNRAEGRKEYASGARRVSWYQPDEGSYLTIEPHETRHKLRSALRLLRDTEIRRVQRKHDLIPI